MSHFEGVEEAYHSLQVAVHTIPDTSLRSSSAYSVLLSGLGWQRVTQNRYYLCSLVYELDSDKEMAFIVETDSSCRYLLYLPKLYESASAYFIGMMIHLLFSRPHGKIVIGMGVLKNDVKRPRGSCDLNS